VGSGYSDDGPLYRAFHMLLNWFQFNDIGVGDGHIPNLLQSDCWKIVCEVLENLAAPG